MARRIAIGGIHTECSTYSPLVMQREDFAVARGDALREAFAPAAEAAGIELVPLFHANALPGGPVAREVYDAFKAEFLTALAAAGPLDGVCLLMHGAVFVEGMDDAEADWIAAVRDAVGEDCIIGAAYDLHGNVSQAIVDQLDAFTAYRTAPHIDVRETHLRAFRMVANAVVTGVRPGIAWAPVPVLMPGERTSTVDEPARALYARLPEVDRREGVLDASLLVGYVWADEPRGTASAVVTGTDADAMATAASDLATAYWDERAAFDFGVTTGPTEAMLDLAARSDTGPVILADSGDNPTGGGVGDRTDVLAALLRRDIDNVLVAGIADPAAADTAAKAGEGATITLALGGALGSDCPPLDLQVEVHRVVPDANGRGLQVVVRTGGVRIVVTARRCPFHNLADFAALGEEVGALRLLVVKSGYLSPALAPLANPALMALSDGAVNQDIAGLANTRRRHPSYPFQTGFDWQPSPALSRRFPG